MTDIERIAARLDSAASNAQSTEQITADQSLSKADAYAVQRAVVQRRLERGERLVGVKLGFTSHAKMKQMGVDDLIWGHLTDAMILPDGGTLTLSDYIHPRVEPELAVLLNKPLAGRITLLQAMAAVEAVAPAMEIIDSRYRNFKFSLADVIADNSSSSAFVVGSWKTANTDISNLGMLLEVNGDIVETGSSAAILGNPWRSLVEAARLLSEHDMQLEPGWILMLGAATAAHPLTPGAFVQAQVETLGRVSFAVNQ